MDETQISPILSDNEASIFNDSKRLLSDSKKIRAAAKTLHREAQIYRQHAQRLRQLRKPAERNPTEKVVFSSFCQ